MCGIVGYVGGKDAVSFLVDGLRRLEYRGYDSAGIVTVDKGKNLQVNRSVGRIDALATLVEKQRQNGNIGIGHTRWATHGPATVQNAHPHLGGRGAVAIVHNGVIENYESLKQMLVAKGYVFQSATDSEVIAHLIADSLRTLQNEPSESTTAETFDANSADNKPLEGPNAPYAEAVRNVLPLLRGTYGLVVMFRDKPDLLVAARCGSPLVLGVGRGEQFIASDVSPLVGRTDRIIYLADHQMAIMTADSIQVIHRDQGRIRPDVRVLENQDIGTSSGEYEHYMQKEIHEQPESIRNAMRGRLDRESATAKFGGLNLTPIQLRSVDRIILTGCGTSWHSALVGEYLIETFARLPVEVEYASELRYRNPPIDRDTLIFGITQSGETADTLAALREMKRKGHHTLAVCNVIGSSIAQEADGGIYLHAGPEIGVASTKAYTSQITVLAMLGLYFGRLRHLSFEAGLRIIDQLENLPNLVEAALTCDAQVQKVAEKYKDCATFLYLGRNYNFPTALEGALKLKEISYIHAEGYPSAEMKHGPIALVDENTPCVFVVSQSMVYDKVMSNLQEVKARGGPVIAIVDKVDSQLASLADDIIEVPSCEDFLQPIVCAIPLQLLAYHIAVLRGCDVDKPRNLAKSVTVE